MAFGNDPTTGTFSPTQGNVDAALKEYYRNRLEYIVFKDRPFFGLINKKEDVTGRNYDIFLDIAAGQAQSNSFAGSTAGQQLQTAAGNTGEQFYVMLLPKVESHFVANISNKAIYETSSSVGAVVDIVTRVADSQLDQFARNKHLQMYRQADGSLGNVAGSVAGTTLTFSNVADAVNFEVGMFLDFAGTNSGTTVRSLASNNTACQISALDKIGGVATVKWIGTGTQTLTANNVVVGDYIYRSGDKSTCFNGFKDFIPYGGVTSSDSFLSVNRSAEPSRLAGTYMDGTGGNLEEVLQKSLAQVARLGGRINTVFCPFGQWNALATSQGSKVQYIDVEGSDVTIGFRGLQIVGPKGSINIMPDNACPPDLMAAMDIDAWTMISVNPIVHLWERDGQIWLRSYNQAGMEVRGYSLGNLACHRPIDNINIKVNPIV